MKNLNIDKNYFDRCSIIVSEHIENSLGKPITLPPSVQETLERVIFCEEAEEDLLSLFTLMKGCKYEQVALDNTHNYDNDLDQFFVYTVYAPSGTSDWMWKRDCFVTIEMGSGGDPRYSVYGTAQVYDLGDDQLGDSGFFNWTLGWYARYVSNGEATWDTDSAIEAVNNELSQGWGTHPTSHLRNLCYSDPIWVEELEGYVARLIREKYPMVFYPCSPTS